MSAVNTLIDLLAGRRDPTTVQPPEWDAVISVARAEVLVATLAERLAKAELPPIVAALFADLRAAANVQQVQAVWEAEMARRALDPVGVGFVLMKGTAYAAADLPNAAGRQIGDLDIMVARGDLETAEAALLAAGWEWVKSDPYDDAYYRDHMHELPPLIHKDRDRMIDVHHSILPLTHRSTPDAPAMLADAVTLEGGLTIFSQADMLVHCAAHVLADGDLAGGLRNLWDMHCLEQAFAPAGAESPEARSAWLQLLLARGDQHQVGQAMARARRLAEFLYGAAVDCDRTPLSFVDGFFVRALTARDDWGRPTRPFTRLAFTIRSHWLRMPPMMLARHLWTKWRKRR